MSHTKTSFSSIQTLNSLRYSVITARLFYADSYDTHYLFYQIKIIVLLTGFPSVSGWYNVIDFTGKVRGQIKVEIKPEESESNLRCLASHQSGHSLSPEPVSPHLPPPKDVVSLASSTEEDERTAISETSHHHWVMPEVDQPLQQLPDTQSALATKLSDLDSLSTRLREKLSTEEQQQSTTTTGGNRLPDSETIYYSTIDEGGGQSLSGIQAQLASQLDALKSQLLEQAARLPTYDDDNGDKDNTSTDDDETDSNEGCSRKDPDGGNPSVSPN